MSEIVILGSGSSSVAGIDWFLVGYHGEDVFVVTREHSTRGIEVRTFYPGQKRLDDGSPAAGSHVDDLRMFCRNLKPFHDLNWDDSRKARDLYWSYRRDCGA